MNAAKVAKKARTPKGFEGFFSVKMEIKKAARMWTNATFF